MTKLTIEIEDIADKKACVLALRKLSAAFAAQYGEREAGRMLVFHSDPNDPKQIARRELRKALRDLPRLEPQDLRLVLEYFAMSKPSKRGLAKELARRNVGLNEKWRAWTAERRILEAQPLGAEQVKPPWPKPPPAPYGPKGTTNWRSMQTRIKNIFRDYPDTCAPYGAAPPEIRQEELDTLERLVGFDAMDKALGIKPRRYSRKRISSNKKRRADVIPLKPKRKSA